MEAFKPKSLRASAQLKRYASRGERTMAFMDIVEIGELFLS